MTLLQALSFYVTREKIEVWPGQERWFTRQYAIAGTRVNHQFKSISLNKIRVSRVFMDAAAFTVNDFDFEANKEVQGFNWKCTAWAVCCMHVLTMFRELEMYVKFHMNNTIPSSAPCTFMVLLVSSICHPLLCLGFQSNIYLWLQKHHEHHHQENNTFIQNRSKIRLQIDLAKTGIDFSVKFIVHKMLCAIHFCMHKFCILS